MAVIGKVGGSMLRDNLVRNGVDLTVDTNLTYFDVNNRRVGVNTILPTTELDVNGNVKATSITADSVYIANVFANTTVLQNLYSDNSIIANLFVSGNLLVPVGDNNYPVTATSGQIRYNTETNFFEYYDGYTWNKVAKEGDLSAQITTDLFYGNNVATSFTLSQNSTTQGTFVSINGILQQPGESYVVSGNLLSFITETPVDTDVIEARALTVNSQVGKIQNGDNLVTAEYQSDATGTVKIIVDSNVQVQVTANTTVINNHVVFGTENYAVSSTPVLIDSFDNSIFHMCKYIISAVDATSNQYHAFESLVIHDTSTAVISQYGNVNIGGEFVTVNASVNSGQTLVYATSSTANVGNLKVSKQYLPVS